MFYAGDGLMEKMQFLQTWKEIPEQNEHQFTIANVRALSAGL